jgi:MFS transporter, OFA family, oxalate/formate antiporter
MPLLLPQIAQELQFDKELATGLPSLMFLTTALMATIVGRLLDKFGSRWLIITGSIGLVLTVLGLPYVSNYEQLLSFYINYAIFLSLLGIVSSVFLLNQWFQTHKGIAIGIFLAASSVGGALFPQIAKAHLADGWRNAAFWMGIVGAVMCLLPLYFVRNPVEVQTNISQDTQTTDITLRDAFKSPIFYLVTTVTCILWFNINGFIQNQGFYYKDLRLDPKIGADIASLFSVCAVAGKLLFGFLSDKFKKGDMMLVAILTLTLGCVLLRMSASQATLLYPFALVFGLGFSGAFTMIQLWVAELFAGKSYGMILGVITMADTLAGSYGIRQIGAWSKTQNSYLGSFEWMITLCLIAVACTYLVKRFAVAKQ